VLRLASATAAYGARQLSDGLSPEEARVAAVEAADALEAAAARVRLLSAARLSPAARRRRAVQLVASGLSQREAAAIVGVSPRRCWDYLRGRP